MADDHRLLSSQRIEQSHHVADRMEEHVSIDLWRLVGSTIAAHVGRHRVEPGLREGAELMAPGVPALRKSMTEDDQRACALLGHVHPDAVRLNRAMLDLRHRCRSPLGDPLAHPTPSLRDHGITITLCGFHVRAGMSSR